MAAEETTIFEGWAILELMGHRRLAGHVAEATIAGGSFVRIDISEHPWQDGCTCGSLNPASDSHEDHDHTCRRFREEGDERPLDVQATQFYSPAAVYCITPTSEQTARAVAARNRPAPVQRWELEPARVYDREDDDVPV